MPRTKPWNINPEDLPDELPEKPVFDYVDADKTHTCGLKFKTRSHRLLLWVNAHKREYPSAKWERQTIDTVTMRTGRNNKTTGSLVVKFHTTTNVITVQGKAHDKWLANFSVILDIVNHWEIHPEDIPCVPGPEAGMLSLSFITPCIDGFRASQDTFSDLDLDESSLSISLDSDDSHASAVVEQHVFSISDKKGESTSRSIPSINITVTENEPKNDSNHSVPILDGNMNENVVACNAELIQNSYTRVIDDSNRAVQTLSLSIDKIKADVEKIPNRVFAFLKPNLDLLKKENETNRQLIESQISENKQLTDQLATISLLLHEEKSLLRDTKQKYADLQVQFNAYKREHDKLSKPEPSLSISRMKLTQPPGFPSCNLRTGLNMSFTASTPKRHVDDASKTFCDAIWKPPTASHDMVTETAPITNIMEPKEPAPATNSTATQVSSQSHTSDAEENSNAASVAASLSTPSSTTVTTDEVIAEVRNVTTGAVAHDSNPPMKDPTEPDGDFRKQRDSRFAMYNVRSNAESILIHDSTGKFVDGNKYMGSLKVYKQSANTAEKANEILNRWVVNTNCKYAVAHTGVNDVTDGTSPHRIIKHLKDLLDLMHDKHPNAVIAFSEILFLGRDDRDSNDNEAIKKINDEMETFCTLRDYMFVTHSNLQSTTCKLYVDDKHIDNRGGTAVFVSDILNGTGYRKERRKDPTATSNGRNVRTATYTNKQQGGDALAMPLPGKVANLDNDPQLMKLMLSYCLQNMLKL